MITAFILATWPVLAAVLVSGTMIAVSLHRARRRHGGEVSEP